MKVYANDVENYAYNISRTLLKKTHRINLKKIKANYKKNKVKRIKKQKIKKSEEKNLKNYLLLYPIANNANITTITKTIQIR